MASYQYLLVDARALGSGVGSTIAELPLDVSVYSTLLSSVGVLEATCSLDDPAATIANLVSGNRDLTVLRDGVVVWNGRLRRARRDVESRQWTLSASEPTYLLDRRTIETNKSYVAQDLFAIVRDFHTTVTAKTNGALYRFTVTATNSGTTKTWAFSGRLRRGVLQMIRDLAADSFDFRMDYTSTGELASRLLELGAPSLGVNVGRVIEPGSGLVDLGVEMDIDRAANRVHVIGGGGLVHTSTNTASYSAGDSLLEEVFEHGDETDATSIQKLAQDYARRRKPPVVVYSAEITPTTALPFGAIRPGDTVTLNAADLGVASVQKRVVGVMVYPGPPERILLTFAEPL